MPRKNHILAIVVFFAATAVAYFPAFNAGYNFDDRPLLQNNPHVKSLDHLSRFFVSKDARVAWTRGNLQNDTYRPLQSVSFAVSYSLWGDSPAAFHRENFLLHAINGVLLYFLLIGLLESTLAAFLAALIFLIHPVQVEAVTYLSERASLLSMTFFLISARLFIASQRKAGSSGRYLAASVLTFCLSLLAKETAIILPVVLALYCVCFDERGRPGARAVMHRTWPYFVIALIYVLIRTASLGQVAQVQAPPLWQRLLVSTEAFWNYLALTLFPRHLSFYHEINTAPFALEPQYVFYCLVLLVFVAGAVRQFRKSPRLAFFLFAYLVALLPVSNIVPIKTNMQERFLYFPNAFMFPFVAFYVVCGVGWLGARHGAVARYAGLAAAVLAVIALTARTHLRNRDWQSQETLMLSEVKVHPDNARAYFDVAVERFSRKDYEGARKYSEQALTHADRNLELASIHNLMGRLEGVAGRNEAALEHYRIAIQNDPTYPFPYHAAGLIYAQQGRLKEALACFEKAVEYNPSNAAFYENLGKAHALNGNRERAIAAWNKSLAINPDQPDVRQLIRETGGH